MVYAYKVLSMHKLSFVTPRSQIKNLGDGILLFNRGCYFESHEVLEEVWKITSGEEKLWVQGLIQAAAGFHKLKLGFPDGALKLLKRSAAKLQERGEPKNPAHADFSRRIAECAERIERGTFEWKSVPKMRL